MRWFVLRATLAAAIVATGSQAADAATPAPSVSQKPVGAFGMQSAPVMRYPNVPLHSEVVVEVNHKGQVVRVKSTKPSKMQTFNLQTYGNALQMWIRKPDGSAETGLYRVTYDYDPKTRKVTRNVAIVSTGGNWGNEEGAADVMMDLVKKQAEAAHKQQQEQNAKLPSLNQIRGASPSPKPTPAATLPP